MTDLVMLTKNGMTFSA